MTRALTLSALLVASAAAAQDPKPKPQPQPPLAQFISEHLIVLPVQLLRADTGAFVTAGGWEKFRREVDDSIGAAIAERGLGKRWSYAADVARSAKRNAAYTSDPYSLGVQPLRGAKIKVGDKIPPMFASNLRALIALGDTRFALLPIELVFQRGDAMQRAALRLALVDGRMGIFVWLGDVASDAAPSLTPGMLGSLAARVADLVVAP
jgi:hypothetical protein